MNIVETNLKFKSNHKTRSGKVNGFVLHHAAASGSVETVHGWHLNNGWAGIGYHFYVRKDDTVYRGRPENWIGAHTVGHNEKIGICAEGNYEKETMPDVQRNAISALIAYLWDKYGNVKVYGHRDLDATACPGKNYPFDSIVNGAKGDVKTGATETPTASNALAVDGKWGKATTKRLQQIFGTTVDGVVSNQHACYKANNPGLVAGWDWEDKPNGKGSQLIKAMQKWAGMPAKEQDGEIGAKTIKAFQKKLGTVVDGKVSKPSAMVKALQKWANNQ